MDKNSQRKIIEDKIKGLEGNAFQDFCDRLCITLFPDDYTPVRAGGPKGDTKNDGYCPKARIFFQAHATRREAISKVKSKIAESYVGCLTKYEDIVKWVYLTNDTLQGEIHQHVDQLRARDKRVEIELWDHKIIADKISELPQDKINYIIDINLPSDKQLLQEVENSLSPSDGISKEVAASSPSSQVQNVVMGYSSQKPRASKEKSDDYNKVLNLYKLNATTEEVLEIKKIVYSSTDPEAILQAIMALTSLYKYSPDTIEDQNTLLDIGIETASHMKAMDAEAILRAEKAGNLTTQFCLLDLEGWGQVMMGNNLGWPLITPEEKAAIVSKLKILDAESKRYFKSAVDKAMESKNPLAIARVFMEIGVSSGQKADHFLRVGVTERGEQEKKTCKSAFMYVKSILIQVKDETELAYFMHNFANAIRNFGEKEEALDLVNKSIEIAKRNKMEEFLEKAELLKNRINNPLID